MKKPIKKCFSILLVITLTLTAAPLSGFVGLGEELFPIANAATSGDYEYEVLDDGTARITDYFGTGGDVVIPESIDGYTVTAIGDEAFIVCGALTSIVIPDSVTTIGARAFAFCDALTTVEIPDSVRSIGSDPFYDTGYYHQESNWENGVLYIGNHCIDAKSDEIPTEYTIREGTITIGAYVFAWCAALTSVEIPDSVTTIGYSAFRGCAALTTVEIGDSVTTIGDSAFAYCDALTTVYYTGSEEQWNAIEIGSNNEPLADADIIFNHKPDDTDSSDSTSESSVFSIEQDGEFSIYTGDYALMCREPSTGELLRTSLRLKYMPVSESFSTDDIVVTVENEELLLSNQPLILKRSDGCYDIYLSFKGLNPGTTSFSVKDQNGNTFTRSVEVIGSESYFSVKSTNASNSVPVGEKMDFRVQLTQNGKITTSARSYAVTFSPTGIFKVSKTTASNIPGSGEAFFDIEVEAVKTGSTVMTISDSETGAYISITSTASEKMNVYRFNTVPSTQSYEEGVNTNFYNCNGICITDFRYSELPEEYKLDDEKYFVQMTAYNAAYHFGVVVSYDKNGEIYDSDLIEPHKMMQSSFFDTTNELAYATYDLVKLYQNPYYFTGDSITTKSFVEVRVPEDGYIVITNRLDNKIVYLSNLLDYIINSLLASVSTVSGTISSLDKKSVVKPVILELLETPDNFKKHLVNATIDELLKEPFSKDNINVIANTFTGELRSGGINLDRIINEVLSDITLLEFAEDAFYNFIPTGELINLMFSACDVSNLLGQIDSFEKSQNAPQIIVYPPLNDDSAYTTNGVVVIPEQELDDNYVAHAFTVEESDPLLSTSKDKIEEIAEKSTTYDVTLYKGGVAVQPEGKIKVMLPIPDEYDRSQLAIYWIKDNGEIELMESYLEGDYICFESDHLSYYSIVQLNNTVPPVTEPPVTEPLETEPPATVPPVTNPPITDPPEEPSVTVPSTEPTTEPSTEPSTQPSTEPSTEPPVTEPTEPTEPEYTLGDVNGDGRITSADARLALRAAVSLETLDAVQLLSADANGDGKVTSADARLILRVAVGLDSFEKKE